VGIRLREGGFFGGATAFLAVLGLGGDGVLLWMSFMPTGSSGSLLLGDLDPSHSWSISDPRLALTGFVLLALLLPMVNS